MFYTYRGSNEMTIFMFMDMLKADRLADIHNIDFTGTEIGAFVEFIRVLNNTYTAEYKRKLISVHCNAMLRRVRKYDNMIGNSTEEAIAREYDELRGLLESLAKEFRLANCNERFLNG